MKDFLESGGYRLVREIPGHGWCGMRAMLFTWGLFYGMDRHGIGGRYCFENLADAVSAITEWTGEGDPPGDWIKHFGKKGGERSNMNLNPDTFAAWLLQLHNVIYEKTGIYPQELTIDADQARLQFLNGYSPYQVYMAVWGDNETSKS